MTGPRTHARHPLRALELYCGIGGFAAAVQGLATVACAVDINEVALGVYRRNFPHPTRTATIDALCTAYLDRSRADFWWLSPPCQPFTRRGLRRDSHDPRTQSLLTTIAKIAERRPPILALENVPGFRGSDTHARLREALDHAGYNVQEVVLCPTELGIPNRRRRFYLIASREPLLPIAPVRGPLRRLESFLDREPCDRLLVSPHLVNRYRFAIDLVDRSDPAATTACFTAAYGHSPVRSGSYLPTSRGIRRFSPQEILRFLGFPDDFQIPHEIPLQKAWRLVGNSLSVPAVRCVLAAVPELHRHLSRHQAAGEAQAS